LLKKVNVYKGTYKGMHVPDGGSLSVEARDRGKCLQGHAFPIISKIPKSSLMQYHLPCMGHTFQETETEVASKHWRHILLGEV
jgi:hypothetical protein